MSKNVISAYRFDPEGEYTAIKNCTIAGKQFTRGDDVPNDTVPTRRLRQLYERRFITTKGQYEEYYAGKAEREDAPQEPPVEPTEPPTTDEPEVTEDAVPDATGGDDEAVTMNVNETTEASDEVDDVVAAAAVADEAQAAPEGGEFKAEHKGFGRWYVVDPDGVEISGVLTKDEALSQAAKLNEAE